MHPVDPGFLEQLSDAGTVESGDALDVDFDMRSYLDNSRLLVKRIKPWNSNPGGKVFELSTCPFNADHHGGSAAFTLSPDGIPGFVCKHNACAGRTIRDVFALHPPNQKQSGRTDGHGRTAGWSIDCIPSIWSLNATVSWIIDGIAVEGGVTLLTGDSGVGKSTLACAACSAVVSGATFLGRNTQHRKALYVDRENPLGVVRGTIDRLRVQETPNLIVWGCWVEPQPDSPARRELVEFSREHRPLIVFDSLVAFHTGSEQDASETRRHMHLYRNLASVGASVIVLHHTGKSDGSRQYRGSSDIRAAVDSAWLLKSLSPPGMGLRSLVLEPFKCRAAVVRSIGLEYCDGVFSSSDEIHHEWSLIKEVIWENQDSTQTQLVRLACERGMAKNRAEQILKSGEEDGTLTVRKGARGSKHYTLATADADVS